MFFDYFSEAPTHSGYTSVGVPGFVAGMETVWNTYGTVPLADLLQPAENLAANGFPISDHYARMFNSYAAVSRSNLTFEPSNTPLRGGETLRQHNLAETLRLIRQNGSSAFYTGSVAREICEAAALTEEDLALYRVRVGDPVIGSFYGYEVASAPPPFSGTTLIQMLKAFELTDIPNPKDDEKQYLETLKAISEKTHYDRLKTIGDPSFSTAPSDNLVSKDYVQKLLGLEEPDPYGEEKEHESTAHIVVVDKNGMIVSSTNTLSSFYGSQIYCQGFFLNNSNSIFSSGINSYSRGKRPRTFTSPTIIRGEDGFIMGIGSPGGNRIVKVMAPLILDTLIFGTDLRQSVERNRAVFTGKNTITVESNPNREAAFLTRAPYNYYVVPKVSDSFFGSIQVVGYSNSQGMFAAADSRRDGLAEVRIP
jgi:gamma-glutamyltranspeptidase/glutathione hydrolase